MGKRKRWCVLCDGHHDEVQNTKQWWRLVRRSVGPFGAFWIGNVGTGTKLSCTIYPPKDDDHKADVPPGSCIKWQVTRNSSKTVQP